MPILLGGTVWAFGQAGKKQQQQQQNTFLKFPTDGLSMYVYDGLVYIHAMQICFISNMILF